MFATDMCLAIVYNQLADTEKALVYANNDSQSRDIVNTTIGLIFFGTPHRGNDLRGRLEKFTQSMKSTNPLLSMLQKESSLQAMLTTEFKQLCSTFQILTFFQTRYSRPGSSLVRHITGSELKRVPKWI